MHAVSRLPVEGAAAMSVPQDSSGYGVKQIVWHFMLFVICVAAAYLCVVVLVVGAWRVHSAAPITPYSWPAVGSWGCLSVAFFFSARAVHERRVTLAAMLVILASLSSALALLAPFIVL